MSQSNLMHYFKRTSSAMNDTSSVLLKPLQSLTHGCGSDFESPPSKRLRLTTTTTNSSFFTDDENQMIIDAGQKQFGSEMCKVCGMVYDPTFGPDIAVHEAYHQKIVKPAVSFPKALTKSLELVQEFFDGCIYKVVATSCRMALQLVDHVNSLMDADFGFSNLKEFWKSGRQVYVFASQGGVSTDRKVVGCLIVDQLKYAFRHLKSGSVEDRPTYSILGINRIWVSSNARRRKIATRLLDCARCNFIIGYVVLKKHVAFSDPTPMGTELAKCYAGTDNFYVY